MSTVKQGVRVVVLPASGIPAHGYNSGLSLADATFSGRLAGEAAAKREV